MIKNALEVNLKKKSGSVLKSVCPRNVEPS